MMLRKGVFWSGTGSQASHAIVKCAYENRSLMKPTLHALICLSRL